MQKLTRLLVDDNPQVLNNDENDTSFDHEWIIMLSTYLDLQGSNNYKQ